MAFALGRGEPRALGNVAAVANLLIVGGGKMGGALLEGLLRSGWAQPAEVAVVEPVDERRQELDGAFPGLRTVAAPEAGLLDDGGERVAGAVLAVKPDAAEGACRALGASGVTRVLSIVAGVPRGAWRPRSVASRRSCGPCPTRPRWSVPA